MWRQIIYFCLVLLLFGCSPSASSSKPTAPPKPGAVNLKILAGSQYESIRDIVGSFPRINQIQIEVVDANVLKNKLASTDTDYQAVWPESHIWPQLSGNNQLRNDKVIMKATVVFGVKKSLAQRFGWVRTDANPSANVVPITEIFDAITKVPLRYSAASASQATCGTMWYLNGLYALSGNPYVIGEANLQDPSLQSSLKDMYNRVSRTGNSCPTLATDFIGNYDALDATVNFEPLVIGVNQELTKVGKEPLYVIYPKGATAIANSTLYYLDRGNQAQRDLFQEFQDYLTHPDRQRAIEARGWRTYPLGMQVAPDQLAQLGNVYNSSWGIDAQTNFAQLNLPNRTVLAQALDVYQLTLRPPSFTVINLDYSGSMSSKDGKPFSRYDEMVTGITALLDPTEAAKYLLQFTPDDITVVIPFTGSTNDREVWVVKGNDPEELSGLLKKVTDKKPGGETNIYGAVAKSTKVMSDMKVGNRKPAIILMTDGENTSGRGISELTDVINREKLKVPVFAIQYGTAKPDQLQGIANATGGQVCSDGLIQCFRKARGSN